MAGVKLVCFDLDCTLLNGRLNHSLEEAGVASGAADRATLEAHLEKVGGIKNRMALQMTIRDLLKKGVKIAVTSFNNHPESIPFVLEKIGLTPQEIAQIHNASSRPESAQRHAMGKNNHIEKAIAACGGDMLPQEVVLVDDNINNFELAKQKGYQVIWVQGSEGKVDYLNELREMAGLSTFQAAVPLLQLLAAPAEPPKSLVDKLLGLIGLQRVPSVAR